MLTWNSDKTVCTDANGNSVSIKFFGSIEAAEKALLTLVDCTYCTNCTYCHSCTNCTYCHSCTYCTNCTNCTECRSCKTVLKTEFWSCHFLPNRIIIGCQDHSLESWKNFTENRIAAMSYNAPEFMKKYRDIILAIAEKVSEAQ